METLFKKKEFDVFKKIKTNLQNFQPSFISTHVHSIGTIAKNE